MLQEINMKIRWTVQPTASTTKSSFQNIAYPPLTMKPRNVREVARRRVGGEIAPLGNLIHSPRQVAEGVARWFGPGT